MATGPKYEDHKMFTPNIYRFKAALQSEIISVNIIWSKRQLVFDFFIIILYCTSIRQMDLML